MGSDPIFTKREKAAHYSYAAYADPAMAATFDARRFGGVIGQILLDDQQRIIDAFLPDIAGREVLDIGTGTGRAALALASGGAKVTAIDASEEMLSVARRRASEAGLPISFGEGDVHALAFPDRAFDSAICLRVLMHVPDWRTALKEICRVSARRVVFDYPAFASAASMQAMWRHAASAMGRNVEAYRVLRSSQVAHELALHGFRIAASHKQFVIPIAVHKLIGSARFTRGVESALARAGLLQLAGSPVTVAAERCGS